MQMDTHKTRLMILLLTVLFWITLALVLGCGSSNKVKVSGGVTAGGEVVARVTHEYPQAGQCFTDPRIADWEALKACLELLTQGTYTVVLEGDVSTITGAIPPLSEGDE